MFLLDYGFTEMFGGIVTKGMYVMNTYKDESIRNAFNMSERNTSKDVFERSV